VSVTVVLSLIHTVALCCSTHCLLSLLYLRRFSGNGFQCHSFLSFRVRPLAVAACRLSHKVKVTLRLTVSQSVSQPVWLGIKQPPGAYDQIFISIWQLRSYFCGAGVPWVSRPYFTLSYLRLSDSQGHGGGIRPRLHTGVIPQLQIDSLYSLGTENIAPNSYSIVALICYLVMALVLLCVTSPLPSSDGFFGFLSLALRIYATVRVL
jgi:hypothetical protein